MKRTALSLVCCLLAIPALAQWPAGTPEERQGSYPSPTGNPAPMEEMEVHRSEDGRWVTEEGYEVKGFEERDESRPNVNMHHTEPKTSSDDPPHQRATPGELE